MSVGRSGAESLALDSLVLDSRVDPEALRDAWRAACDDLQTAYDGWRTASTAETADRYWGFVAAVDREEAAAAALQYRLQPAIAGCGSVWAGRYPTLLRAPRWPMNSPQVW